MSEAFDYAKREARKHILRQTGQTTLSSLYGMGTVPVEIEKLIIDLPVDPRFRSPLRDPDTGLPIFPAGYKGAGTSGAGQ